MAKTELHDGNDAGASLGATAAQKIGFHGATPVVQQAAIITGADTTTEFTAGLNSVIAVLRAYGFIPNADP